MKATAFAKGGEIPKRHTCDGADLSPALSWNRVSPAALSLALIVDDPDAPRGTWTHWLIWNIPAHLTALPEGVPAPSIASVMAAHARLPAKHTATSSNSMRSILRST